MKICMSGQCDGGNAKLWFDLFNNHLPAIEDIKKITYICNNPNTMKHYDFKVINLYGKKYKNSFLGKVKMKLTSDYIFENFYKLHFKKNKYDLLHIQGNYSPQLNMKLIKLFDGPVLIHIYGSDYYQKYLNSINFTSADLINAIKKENECVV